MGTMIGVATVYILNDLSRWDDRRALLVQGLQRVAQLVQVRVGGRPVVLVNGHYYWPARLHGARGSWRGRWTTSSSAPTFG